jgi:hypothetical protein
MVLIQYIKKLRVLGNCSCIALPPASVQSSVSSVVNLLNQILSQSRTHRVPLLNLGDTGKNGTRCVPYFGFINI